MKNRSCKIAYLNFSVIHLQEAKAHLAALDRLSLT